MTGPGDGLGVASVAPVDGAAPASSAATPCAVCAGASVRPRYAIAGIAARLVVCTACGTGRLDPMPAEDEIGAFYPAPYYGATSGAKFRPAIERALRLLARRRARTLFRGLAPGARVLDVGCGRGALLSALARRGFEAHGVERSADALRGADPRLRLHVAPDLSRAALPAESFDAVVLWHVLEHLRDPRAALREARRLLRPSGRLLVAVPNFASAQARWAGAAWFHLDLPRHLHHFPLAGLRRLLDASGFRCESVGHFSLDQGPFGWIQSAENRDPTLPREGLYTLLHAVGPGAAPPFDARTRRRLLRRGALLAPLALALSLAESVARCGAVVHVVARRSG